MIMMMGEKETQQLWRSGAVCVIVCDNIKFVVNFKLCLHHEQKHGSG